VSASRQNRARRAPTYLAVRIASKQSPDGNSIPYMADQEWALINAHADAKQREIVGVPRRFRVRGKLLNGADRTHPYNNAAEQRVYTVATCQHACRDALDRSVDPAAVRVPTA
jgi:hypothetical protein